MRRSAPLRRAALRLQYLEDRTVPVAYTWDGGPSGTGTAWLTAANWNPDGVPTIADTAVVNSAAGDITIAGNAAALSVTVNGAVNLVQTSGALSLGAAASKFYVLLLNGGTLSPASGATLTGNTSIQGTS